MDEKRNEGRLIDVPPGEVIAAGDVVKFIAEIAVPIIEVEMNEELGQGYGPNDRHARPERRTLPSFDRHGKGMVSRGCGHGEGYASSRAQVQIINIGGDSE